VRPYNRWQHGLSNTRGDHYRLSPAGATGRLRSRMTFCVLHVPFVTLWNRSPPVVQRRQFHSTNLRMDRIGNTRDSRAESLDLPGRTALELPVYLVRASRSSKTRPASTARPPRILEGRQVQSPGADLARSARGQTHRVPAELPHPRGGRSKIAVGKAAREMLADRPARRRGRQSPAQPAAARFRRASVTRSTGTSWLSK